MHRQRSAHHAPQATDGLGDLRLCEAIAQDSLRGRSHNCINGATAAGGVGGQV